MNTFVMVIDDSPTTCKIVEVCLTRAGYQVKSFPDGVEALGWLVSPQARLPGLVFLDIGLPSMDGFEVAMRLKATPQCKDIVIVMLTRRDGVVERLKARLVGAKEYIAKPFQTQEILAVVARYLGVPAPIERDRYIWRKAWASDTSLLTQRSQPVPLSCDEDARVEP